MSNFNFHSGRLRHVVNVLEVISGSDDFGLPNKPTLLFESRGNVQVKSGSQMESYGTVLTSSVITVLMRYDEAVHYDHLLEWNGHYYEIQHIQPDERERDMIVTAEVKEK